MNVSLLDSIDEILERIKLIKFQLTYIIVYSTIFREFINKKMFKMKFQYAKNYSLLFRYKPNNKYL